MAGKIKGMKNKHQPVLNALLFCSLASNAPAFAGTVESARVKTLEASVKIFEDRGQIKEISYVDQLLGLADAYRADGRRAEAQATFRKAIAIGSKLPYFDIPHAMLMWATALTQEPQTKAKMSEPELKDFARLKAAYEKDLPNAEKILNEGLELVRKLPPQSDSRLNYMIGSIRFYKATNKKAQMQTKIGELDLQIQALERDQKLPVAEIPRLAEKIKSASQLFAQVPQNSYATAMVPATVVPDSQAETPGRIKQSDFNLAEKYQLNAIALYDRLPEKDLQRIDAHRNLAQWYSFLNQTPKAMAQTQILSKLLHTTDRNILFPPKDPCYGCGRG